MVQESFLFMLLRSKVLSNLFLFLDRTQNQPFFSNVPDSLNRRVDDLLPARCESTEVKPNRRGVKQVDTAARTVVPYPGTSARRGDRFKSFNTNCNYRRLNPILNSPSHFDAKTGRRTNGILRGSG